MTVEFHRCCANNYSANALSPIQVLCSTATAYNYTQDFDVLPTPAPGWGGSNSLGPICGSRVYAL